MANKIHMQKLFDLSYCGAKPDMKYPWHTCEVAASTNFTNDPEKVTCLRCIGLRKSESTGGTRFNKYQKLAAKHYCGGEMNHVQDMEDVRNCGDGLFRFIMVELSDDEDCDTDSTALLRIERALEEMAAMSNSFEEALSKESD